MRLAALLGGPLLGWLVGWLLPADFVSSSGELVTLSDATRAAAALGVWMAIWWLTEAVNISVTALLPVLMIPLWGAGTLAEACAPYAHPLIFLFLGGFLLALSMQRWGLHRRFALRVLSVVGSRPTRVIAGFMAVTAALSMWVSNTATVVMMLPIALSVLTLVGRKLDADGDGEFEGEQANLPVALLLGVAYAGSIGGIGTLIGSPPNLIAATFLSEELGVPMDFVSWMKVGLPLVVLFLPLCWWLLTRRLLPVGAAPVEGIADLLRHERESLGPVSRGEWVTLGVFCAAAALWVSRPYLGVPGLSDAGIAMGAALVLFVSPVDLRAGRFVLEWETARGVPWGTLLLFGGGLSLAGALSATGVTELIGSFTAGLSGLPGWLVVGVVAALVIFLTELTSNTATTATLVPVLAGLAGGLGLAPAELVIPAALAASCAFMLPVATPPNAIVYGSGKVPLQQMIRAGLWLNLIGIVLITLLAALLIR
ncbi:MAG: DASS family sodium-coupled anion symporter [Deltaproteobacteria bacterium]|nr:DASS family sodium-coupled anion symporter [Deltaproteobacteria bacterium]